LDNLKSTGQEQLKRKETAWDGHHGIKQNKSQKTRRSGDAALKPYAPTGTKKKGEGERRQSSNNCRFESRWGNSVLKLFCFT